MRIRAAGESSIRHHHVDSQCRPLITPPMRTGLTTQFARQPTVENVISK
jgi:hypothetical protein